MYVAFTWEKGLPFKLKGMMRHEQTLNVRQSTELSMTPRLQQAIALLQLSTVELNQYIEGQLLENPLLMQEDDLFTPNSLSDNNYADNDDTDYINTPKPTERNTNDNDQTPLWKAKETLHDYLSAQIQIAFPHGGDRLIAAELMLHLNEDGLLDNEWTDVAQQLNVKETDVERVLSILQTFDPPGLFARSIMETLALQLKDKGIMDPESVAPMLNAFQQLTHSTVEDVAKQAHISLDTFHAFLGHLRHLQFRPAQSYNQHDARTSITPDVRIITQSDGALSVMLNTVNLPRVLVNSQYYHDIKNKITRAEELNYVKEKFASANWLIQSLQKRAVTLLQVSSEIAHWQHDFFAAHNNPLKPMTLREIAEAAGVHESTVSRITTAKYIQTPRGLFELKALFTHAVGSKNSTSPKNTSSQTSSNEIQHVLRQIIAEECKTRPLSDEDLVQILQSKGLTVARRTIAKYRGLLGIASSSDRKRHNIMKTSLKLNTL
jgi:RNA polymerase sigma-54 factor